MGRISEVLIVPVCIPGPSGSGLDRHIIFSITLVC